METGSPFPNPVLLASLGITFRNGLSLRIASFLQRGSSEASEGLPCKGEPVWDGRSLPDALLESFMILRGLVLEHRHGPSAMVTEPFDNKRSPIQGSLWV